MAKKILIVDDEADVVKVLKKRLEDFQFDVVTAYDGDEGLDKVRAEKPQLVILDVMMPNVDGYTFLRELKADPATDGTPVIMLTAKGDGLRELFALEGVCGYVTKPYDVDVLLQKINQCIRQH